MWIVRRIRKAINEETILWRNLGQRVSFSAIEKEPSMPTLWRLGEILSTLGLKTSKCRIFYCEVENTGSTP